jgi:hypothetical protein
MPSEDDDADLLLCSVAARSSRICIQDSVAHAVGRAAELFFALNKIAK